MISAPRKRKVLSLQEKLSIISAVENGEKKKDVIAPHSTKFPFDDLDVQIKHPKCCAVRDQRTEEAVENRHV